MSTSQNMAAMAGGPPEWRNRGEFPGGPGAVPTAGASPQGGSYFYGGDSADNTASSVFKDLEVYAAINPPGTNTPDIVSATTGTVFIAKTPEQFTYDLDGNMTFDGRFHYFWNGENRLVCASNAEVIVTYAYDHRGRMVRKEISHRGTEARRVEYLWDDWNIIREIQWPVASDQWSVGTLATGHCPLVTDYVWGLDLDGTLQGAGGVGGLLAVLRSDCAVTNSAFCILHSALYFPTYDANGNVSEYVSTNGQCPVYAGNEINYIGIGLYEAWLCDSLIKAKTIVWLWKLYRWGDIPSKGTMHWLEVGYNNYAGLKPENDSCCRCKGAKDKGPRHRRRTWR